jgi:TonB family protein
MVYRVKRNWIFPPASAYGLKGVVGIYLLVKRDGSLSGVHIRKTSGVRPFDQAAFNAIELSLPLSPLPDDFPHEDLPAYFLFYYN